MSKSQLIKTSESTGVMRGRDVHFALSGKVDPELLKILTTLAEINHTNTLALAELATMFDQMIDTMQSFGDVAENFKNKAEQFDRAMGQMKEASEGNPDA
jgi:hypothetical protein